MSNVSTDLGRTTQNYAYDYNVIGIVGPVRAGKTTACKYLKKNHNATNFRNSEVLEQITQNLHMNMNRDNLSHLGMTLYNVFGRDLLAKYWIENIKNINPDTDLIVIDGLRFPEEVIFYRQHCNFTLVAITAPDDIRYNRSKTASDNFKDGMLDHVAFLKQSTRTNESHIEQLIKDSDIIITNNTTLNEFYYKLDKIVIRLSA